jgi:Tfp pilus assembly protein PilZ
VKHLKENAEQKNTGLMFSTYLLHVANFCLFFETQNNFFICNTVLPDFIIGNVFINLK